MGWSYSIVKIKGWEVDDYKIEKLIEEGKIEGTDILSNREEDLEILKEHYKNDPEMCESIELCRDLYVISDSVIGIRLIKHEGLEHEIWYYGSDCNDGPCNAILPFKWDENQSELIKLFKIKEEANIVEFVVMG